MSVSSLIHQKFAPGVKKTFIHLILAIIMLEVVSEITEGVWRIHTGILFPIRYILYPIQHLWIPVFYWIGIILAGLLVYVKRSSFWMRILFAFFLFSFLQVPSNHKFLLVMILGLLSLDQELESDETPSLSLLTLQLDIVYAVAAIQKLEYGFYKGSSLINLLSNLQTEHKGSWFTGPFLQLLEEFPEAALVISSATILIQLALPLLLRKKPTHALGLMLLFHVSMALVIPGIWIFTYTMLALGYLALKKQIVRPRMMSMEQIKPYLVEKPWGGNYLSQFYKTEKKHIGEAWLLSTLPEGESKVGDKRLSEYLGHPLSFLIKVIDAKDPLSIQVHPNDEWAKKFENSRGKTECWLILNVEPGSGLYLGLNEGVTEQEFRSAILKNESVEKLMKFYPAKVGDFISVPAGTIHAIGGGVTLMEVQQSSGITYRLWDWGRTDRELHIDKGLTVSDFTPKFEYKHDIFKNLKRGLLLKHSDFEAYLNESHGEGWFVDLETYEVHRGSTTKSESYILVK